jgi:hypothetical protein
MMAQLKNFENISGGSETDAHSMYIHKKSPKYGDTEGILISLWVLAHL